MKKTLLTLTAIILAISLTACSENSSFSGEAPTNGFDVSFSSGTKGGAAEAEGGGAAGGAASVGGAAPTADAPSTGGTASAGGTASTGSAATAGDEALKGTVVDADRGAAEGIAAEPDKTVSPEFAGRFDITDERYAVAEDIADFAEEAPMDDYAWGEEGVYKWNNIPEAAGTLTAGEWIDNNHYSFWQDLFQKEDTGWESYRRTWDRSYCARTFVTVSRNGKPVENSSLTLTNGNGKVLWQAKTDNEGKAYLFYSAAELSKGDLTVTADFGGEMTISSENDAVSFNLDAPEAGDNKSLDMALLVDTTGSMSDELSYLQKELENVIERVAKDNGNIPVRLSVNFYRDDGDEYIVRNFDFTENISDAISDLIEQEADGGGDYPEKVNAALDSAINELSWEEDSTKLLFIILDAPPHSNDSTAVAQMNELTEQAAAKGIRLIPILASGGDKETEFLMRDFALKTGGTYLFLTDDSGVSVGGHVEPTIGDYQVEKLNDLMVNVTNRYLAVVQSVADYIDEYTQTKPSENTTEPEPIITVPPTAWRGKVIMILDDTAEDDPESPLEFTITNETEYEYYYGLGFTVEKFTESGWEEIPPTEEFAVIEIAMILAPGDSHTFKAPVYTYWKDLEAGKYQVVLNVSSEMGSEKVYGLFEKK